MSIVVSCSSDPTADSLAGSTGSGTASKGAPSISSMPVPSSVSSSAAAVSGASSSSSSPSTSRSSSNSKVPVPALGVPGEVPALASAAAPVSSLTRGLRRLGASSPRGAPALPVLEHVGRRLDQARRLVVVQLQLQVRQVLVVEHRLRSRRLGHRVRLRLDPRVGPLRGTSSTPVPEAVPGSALSSTSGASGASSSDASSSEASAGISSASSAGGGAVPAAVPSAWGCSPRPAIRATRSAWGLRSTASARKRAAAATWPASLSLSTPSVMKPMSSAVTVRPRS